MEEQPLPPWQTGIVQTDAGSAANSLPMAISRKLPLPSQRPGDVLIRTLAVALNPYDHKVRVKGIQEQQQCIADP